MKENDSYRILVRFVFLTIMTFGFICVRAQSASQTISSIDERGSWYYVYDEKGRKVATLSKSVGKLEGYGSDWFVVTTSSWLYLYDINGRKYHTKSRSSVGEVVSVGSNTFVTRKGSWLYTFDRNGKKIATRSAR